MRVLHVYPVNKLNQEPSSWRKSQIESLTPLKVLNFKYPLFKRKSLIDLIKYGIELRKCIKSNEIDVVHCHWGATLGLFATLFSQVPVVVSFCGSDLFGNYNKKNKKTLKGRLSRFLSRTASRFSKFNIVKSKRLFEELPESSQKKSFIVPNGVDKTSFFERDKTSCRKELNLPEDKYIVLFVNSGGAWEKNAAMAREIGKKLNNRFHFLEVVNVPFSDIPKYYASSDFLLITSFHEGSCNVLKEALFSSLKVISSPTGDAEERLDGVKGCLVSNSIDNIVTFIYENKEIEFNAPKEKIEEISLEFIATKIHRIYEKAIKKPVIK